MEKLFWKLYKTHYEKDITKIISNNNLLTDPNNWKPYGNNKGNFGTFESQQFHPIPALVEKITNSIDAMLTKECLKNEIDPTSKEAPRTMLQAVEKFYNVRNGEIGELDRQSRRKIAENIQILAFGDKKEPSIVIYDNGEGQNPNDFENTFLSLHRNNKTNIQFVQGKYNMGATGAVVFCGEHKYHLIASKRSTELSNKDNKFGFTLIRKHPLSKDEEENTKATWYEYFCPNGIVPQFDIDEIDIGLKNRLFKSGSIVKLYSYQLPRGSRSDITFDLYRDLNQFMYELPLPLLLFEKRDFKGHSKDKLVLGNKNRIVIDDNSKVEIKPKEYELNNSDIGELKVYVTIFKKGDEIHKEYIKNKSIIYSLNGQVHGFEGQSFISQNLGYSLLKDTMLIYVDCTNLNTSFRQDLFMSNRTQLKEGPKIEKLRDIIITKLKTDKTLKAINEERKNAIFKNSGSNQEEIEKLLQKIPQNQDMLDLLRKNGSLNIFKTKGNKISNKQNKPKVEDKELKRFPSIFKLKNDKYSKKYKAVPINGEGHFDFETDVEDDFLYRPYEKGKLTLEILQKRNETDKEVKNKSPEPNKVTDFLNVEREGPNNGNIKIIVKPNENVKVGDEIDIKAKLSDVGKDHEVIFKIKVDKEIAPPKEKKKPKDETFPALPRPQKAYENPIDNEGVAWKEMSPEWTGDDIVRIIPEKNDNNEMYISGIVINMDSFILKNFVSKNQLKSEKQIQTATDKYFLSIYLHSLFLFSIFKKMEKENENIKDFDVEDFIAKMMKPYSSFLIYEMYNLFKYEFDSD
jgi:hypothetical protein